MDFGGRESQVADDLEIVYVYVDSDLRLQKELRETRVKIWLLEADLQLSEKEIPGKELRSSLKQKKAQELVVR